MLCARRGLSVAVSNSNLLHPSYSSNRLARSIRPSYHSPLSRQVGSLTKLDGLVKPDGPEEEDDLLSSLTKRRGGRKKGIQKISPKDWLLSEDGLKFRHPTIGRTNWLGDQIPFPTNPWFKPKPPLSDKSKTKVYESFKQRVNLLCQQNSFQELPTHEKKRQEEILIRETSEQWGICRDRISAIIRLKAMEHSWSISDQSEEAQTTPPDHRKTLQLNFEKGMESVLGVQPDQVTRMNDDDIHKLANRRLQRKAKFYGTQFVPLDSPPLELQPLQPPSEVEHQPLDKKQKYQELDEPSETRHITGKDGLPRPPTCYISKPAGKIPMVFTDVSEFPRAPKPMSKAKQKYYPKTSLLPDYSAMQSTSYRSTGRSNPTRRSHSTMASSLTHSNQSILTNHPPFAQQSINGVFDSTTSFSTADSRVRIEEQKRDLTSQLLRQLKGCANSQTGSKIIDEICTSAQGSKLLNLTAADQDEVKESLILQAGGCSFKTSGSKSTVDYHRQNQINPSSTNADQNQTSLSEDEKKIRSIKFDMMKSIYLKKLELNSSGRLLLPRSVRLKEEKDFKILSASSLSSTATNTSRNDSEPSTVDNSRILAQNPLECSDQRTNQVGNRSNRLIRQCMKGPLGRMQHRQNMASTNS